MKFAPTEGPADRIIRALLAAVLLIAGYVWLTGWSMWAAYIVAAVLAFTAATGFCLPYALLGWNTLPKKK